MESFTITCTTCQQRLKVRDDSAIGEIQICPKCGSMVLVEGPSGDADAHAAQSPRAADSSDGACNETGPLADDDQARIDQDAGAARLESADIAGEEGVVPPPIPERPDDESTDVDETTRPIADGGQEQPILPAAGWMSDASRRRQQILLIGGSAIIGTVLAFGLFAFVVSQAFRSPSEDPAGPSETAPHSEKADSEPNETEVAATDTGESGTAEPIDAADPQPPEDAAEEPSDGAPQDEPRVPDPSAPPNKTVGDGQKDDSGGNQGLDSDVIKQTPDGPAAKPAVTPAVIDDGTSPVPTENAAEAASKEDPAATPGPTPASKELTEALDQFAPFIDPDAFVKPPVDTEPVEMSEPELDPNEPQPEQQPVPRPEPRQVDVAERWNDPILEIEFENGSLNSFLRLMMGLSTIPMTLDPDALALVNETPRSPVRVQQKDTTVGQVLSAALSPLRLAAVPVGEQIVITRPTPPGGTLRTYEHPVGDLVGDDRAALSQLGAWIVQMIEPGSWEDHGGDGEIAEKMPSLVIGQRDTILFRVIVFCERLRAARGLPPQSNFDRRLFDLEPRLSRAATGLNKAVTLNYSETTSFVEIVDALSDASGVDILIDWQALAELGWNPDAETTLIAGGEPLGDSLHALLDPMGLTYRVIHANGVQVTSPQVLENRLEVEFYPCRDWLSDSADADDFVDRVRRALGGEALDRVAASLRVDRPSGYLIAALPQPLHGVLAARLDQWRKSTP